MLVSVLPEVSKAAGKGARTVRHRGAVTDRLGDGGEGPIQDEVSFLSGSGIGFECRGSRVQSGAGWRRADQARILSVAVPNRDGEKPMAPGMLVGWWIAPESLSVGRFFFRELSMLGTSGTSASL